MTIAPTIDIETIAEGVIQKVQLNPSPCIPTADIAELVNQMKEFELGRSMLTNGGFTSSWVDYMCHNETSPTHHPLETWILSKAPRIRAARERYCITRDVLQSYLRSNMVLCVMPCGVISKVAELDYSKAVGIKIIGYDNDIQGLVRAETQMQPLVEQQKIDLLLLKKNVWHLDDHDQHDLIISNRLSVLEADSQKVLDLFERFYVALKKGGVFVSSFFTPSPLNDLHTSPWKDVDPNDLLIEHSIFADIMDFHPVVRSELKMRAMLQQVGFKVVDVLYDTHCIYPTVIAQKA